MDCASALQPVIHKLSLIHVPGKTFVKSKRRERSIAPPIVERLSLDMDDNKDSTYATLHDSVTGGVLYK